MLMTDRITLKRATAGTWTKGRRVAGTPTSSTLVCSVQSATGRDLQYLFGQEVAVRDARVVISETELHVAEESDNTQGDIVVINGTEFEVIQSLPEQTTASNLRHYEYIVKRIAPDA